MNKVFLSLYRSFNIDVLYFFHSKYDYYIEIFSELSAGREEI